MTGKTPALRIGFKMTQTTRTEQQGHMTPPAYDFHDGLRVWIDGKVATTFPRSYYGNLLHDLIEQMQKDLER